MCARTGVTVGELRQVLDHSPLAGGVWARTETQQEPIRPIGVTAVAGWALPPVPARGRSGAGRAVPLGVGSLEVLDDVLAGGLVVGRVFAVLAAQPRQSSYCCRRFRFSADRSAKVAIATGAPICRDWMQPWALLAGSCRFCADRDTSGHEEHIGRWPRTRTPSSYVLEPWTLSCPVKSCSTSDPRSPAKSLETRRLRGALGRAPGRGSSAIGGGCAAWSRA